MPINPSALSAPDPDDAAAREQGLPTTEDAKTMDADDLGPDPAFTPDPGMPGDTRELPQKEPATRKRRSKVQMIADAVVPADDAPTALKDSGTGAKIERPWLVAVEMVKDGKADWADKSMKYALLKYEQQKSAPAFAGDGQDHPAPATDAFGRPSPEQLEASQLPTDGSGQMIAPEGSEHGDEVIVGSKTYYVGPGGVLVDGVVDAAAKRRWQRELGTGVDGPWQSTSLNYGAFDPSGSSTSTAAVPATQNGNGGAPKDVTIERERLPHTTEQVDDGSGDGVLKWKIGNGVLEKIGMPNYSSFQIGPISVSRMVVDDGRRTVVPLSGGREGEVPTAVIEAFETIDNTVEFIAARFRGQLMSFFQATGAIQQPVS